MLGRQLVIIGLVSSATAFSQGLVVHTGPCKSSPSPLLLRHFGPRPRRDGTVSFMPTFAATTTTTTTKLYRCLRKARFLSTRVLLSSSSSKASPQEVSTDTSCATTANTSVPNGIGGLPQYGIGSIDLTQKWFDLVKGGDVVATTSIKDPDATVRYGIRTVNIENDGSSSSAVADTSSTSIACMEFVEEITDHANEGTQQQSTAAAHPRVQQINATLSRMQSSISSASSSSQYAVQYERVGEYAAQLQLVRTLRPPPSAGFAASGGDETTCHPPPYDATADSFVVGRFRLQLRPLVGAISTDDLSGLSTGWDIYHNVSPADSRGHYLLIPTLLERDANWRGQVLTRSDCIDLVVLTDSVHPAGSALISYNSVGAGASQNHIHCHLWPCPPIPLLGDGIDSKVGGWECYAVSKAEAVASAALCNEKQDNSEVAVSLLDYPVCCIKLSSTSTIHLGAALGTVIDAVQSMFDAPHNVGLLNRSDGGVDAYVFVRSRERSPRIVPGSRCGSSEMMGVFHTSSEDQLNELVSDEHQDSAGDEAKGAMETVLRDVSYEPRDEVWSQILKHLHTSMK